MREEPTLTDVLVSALEYVNRHVADNERTGNWEITDPGYDHTVVVSALKAVESAKRVVSITHKEQSNCDIEWRKL
jgi:hypothetical protein